MDSHPNWLHRVLLCFEIVVVCEMSAFWVLVFNVTFNNISLISWWSVLLVEETKSPKYPEKTTDLLQVTD